MEFLKDNHTRIAAVIIGAIALVAVYLVYMISAAKADTFTGCYGGVGAGYGAANTDGSFISGGYTVASIDGLGSTGAALNLTAGCDKQFEKFVVGLFGDYVWHDQDTKISFYGGSTKLLGLDDQWTVGGRAGYVVAPTTLVYGLVAFTHLDMTEASFDGYQLGGGIETGLGGNWFLDARYTVSLFDKKEIPFGGCYSGCSIGLEPEVHVGRVGLVYRFNFEAPVVAAMK